MLTARDAVEDRVQGLDTGADDYLDEAVLVRRAARAAARARAARAGASARPSSTSASLRLDPATRAGLAGRDRDRPVDEGVRAARDVHAPARARPLAARSARACMGLRLREPVERDRRLRALPAREGRPPVRAELDRDRSRRRLPAARRTAASDCRRVSDPLPADARLRGRDGASCSRRPERSSTSGWARLSTTRSTRASAAARTTSLRSCARGDAGLSEARGTACERGGERRPGARPRRSGRRRDAVARSRPPARRELRSRRATRSTIVVDGVTVPGSDDPFRLLATPIELEAQDA